MNILIYWWQGIILLGLFLFLYFIYKEMTIHHLSEPAAILLVVKGPVGSGEKSWPEGQVMLLFTEEPLELNGEKVFFQKEKIYLDKAGEIRRILPGEAFEFAGGCLQLVRWDNARQLVNGHRIGQKV